MRPDPLLRSDVSSSRIPLRPPDAVALLVPALLVPAIDDGDDWPRTLREFDARIGANLRTIDSIWPEAPGV